MSMSRLERLICPPVALLLIGCSQPSSESPAAGAAPSAQATPPTTTAIVDSGPHRLELMIGPHTPALSTRVARLTRVPAFGAEGVDAVEIEVMDPDNTVFAKADLFVSTGAALEGEYRLGLRSRADIANVPGTGQVITAIEHAGEREIRVSGEGSLRLEREQGMLVARFDYAINGFTDEPLDHPVSGVMRVLEARIGD